MWPMARGEERRGGNRKDRWKRKERDMGGEASTNDVLPPLGQDLWVLFRGEEKDRYTRSIYAKQPASCILYRGWLYLSVSRLRGYLSSRHFREMLERILFRSFYFDRARTAYLVETFISLFLSFFFHDARSKFQFQTCINIRWYVPILKNSLQRGGPNTLRWNSRCRIRARL